MNLARNKKNHPIRVLIADDHDIFKQILTLTLEEAGIEIVYAASNGREAVEATLEHRPDCVLLDIAMPQMDGLAALSVVKYLSPATPVIIVTALADPLYRARASELGVDAFFTKDFAAQDLIDAIRALNSGKRVPLSSEHNRDSQPPSLPGYHSPKEGNHSPTAHDLTDQESLILSLVAMGLSNPAIMDKLHISKNTVKTHIRNIFSKLGVSDRTQAAVWAFHNGFGILVQTLD